MTRSINPVEETAAMSEHTAAPPSLRESGPEIDRLSRELLERFFEAIAKAPLGCAGIVAASAIGHMMGNAAAALPQDLRIQFRADVARVTDAVIATAATRAATAGHSGAVH